MSSVGLTGKTLKIAACVCTALALVAASAQGAAEPHPHVGKLPGYPVIRGVVPVLGSKTAVSAHEKLVEGAFAAARTQHHALEANPGGIACPEEFAFTQNVCYQGGPVLRNVHVHVIFWLGPNSELLPLTPNVKAFPNSYRGKIVQYFTDVAHDRNVTSDVYAVDPQYFDETGPGVNESLFSEADAVLDEKVFPTNTPEVCSDVTASSEGPCLLDSDIQKEVESVATKEAWGTGLGNIFFVFTPPGVGSCTEFGCAYQAYCAYHGDFGGEGVFPSAGQMIYANIPFAEPGVCGSENHPNSAAGEGTDAAIDVASHEFNESITDPLGSQCKSFAKKECEPFSWTDAIGQEIADKCLPPEVTVAGIYGPPLVEGLGALSFNQEINSHHYYTQRVWSNEAGLFEGGCVQRAINASFTISAGTQATVPMTLDGSASGAPGDPATYWVWNFGGGEQVGTGSPTISHAFSEAGGQVVALTAYDRYGNSEATVESFNVGPAPTSLSPPPPPPPNVITIREPITPGHLTAGQVGTKLGLRATKLSGKGPFTLGRAECPPACGVTVHLYAKVGMAVGGRHSTKLMLIGSAHFTLAAKGAKKLVLSLNAKGKMLLRANRSLHCRLVVTVEGQEGGAWQIVRLPTLTR